MVMLDLGKVNLVSFVGNGRSGTMSDYCHWDPRAWTRVVSVGPWLEGDAWRVIYFLLFILFIYFCFEWSVVCVFLN